jgi:hypothetical protein
MAEFFLGDGLIFEDSLPVGFTPGPLPVDTAMSRLNADNQQLLAAEYSLDEVRVQEALKDESPALIHELQRLEFKLNVLLRLTAELARRDHHWPPAHPVRLSAHGIEWSGEDAPSPGSTGMVDVYINGALPQPLRFPATVIGEGVDQNGVRVARLQFANLSQQVVESLDRFIFRHHRRSIAGAKLPPAPRD